MSFVRLLILKLHIHECPADKGTEDERERGVISNMHPCHCAVLYWHQQVLNILCQFLNVLNTHSSCLIERVVKLRLHSDLSVRVGVDKRQP